MHQLDQSGHDWTLMPGQCNQCGRLCETCSGVEADIEEDKWWAGWWWGLLSAVSAFALGGGLAAWMNG